MLVSLAVGFALALGVRVLAMLVGSFSTSSSAALARAVEAGLGLLPVAIGALVAVLAAAWQIRAWQPITRVRAALWYEERHPSAHAVVTLADAEPGAIPEGVESWLARQARFPRGAAVPAERDVRTASWNAWRGPLLGVLATSMGLLALALLPLSAPQRVLAATNATRGAADTGSATARVPRLAPWRVEVIPPAYSGQASRVLTDSTSVEALVGTRVRVLGPGSTTGLLADFTQRGDSARVDTLPVTVRDNGWQVAVVMPERPSVLRVTDEPDSRLLALVPRPDSLPLVRLLLPLRDSVYRDTTGTLTLNAEARDDIGLRSIAFEVILTSGAGEQYTARTLTFARKELANGATGTTTYSSTFAALGVSPGDVMHVRAVARDGHPAADREAGVSETRSLRFARAGEYDSVAVEAAPPPAVDSSMLSQRMLLDLTQKLDAKRSRLERDVFVSESRKLAAEQVRIRRAVSAIVFQRLSGDGEAEHVHYAGDGHDVGLTVQAGQLVPTFGGSAGAAGDATAGVRPVGASGQPNNNVSDESPIIAVNRPLLEAYNAMWDAGTALELADTKAAIPAMLRALEAIQRARAAERIYLRGSTRAVVVDLARVRLAGRDTGQASRRAAGRPVPQAQVLLEGRLLNAAELLERDAVAARDSMVALRLDALEAAPALSRALEQVLSTMAAGSDVTESLIRARRTLAAPRATAGLPAWSTP